MKEYIFSKATDDEKAVLTKLGSNIPNALKLLMFEHQHFSEFIKKNEELKSKERKTIRLERTPQLVEALGNIAAFVKNTFNYPIVNQEIFWILANSQRQLIQQEML